MPNVRIQNTVANTRVGYNGPNARVSNFQTGIKDVGGMISAGMPIGLLLALTYAVPVQNPNTYFSDLRPNVRITST